MLLAAMLAMVLAAAAPALAQVTVAGDDNTAAQYVDCSQVQLAVGAQFGDQNAAASDESVATASNELGITHNQVNACLGEVSDVNQGVDYVGDLFFY
jgi:2-phospho-L-lactate guanylyltransferase (CobY/MobA/RfbA family)